MANKSFSVGTSLAGVTLSGWVTSFTTDATQMSIAPGAAAFDFNWSLDTNVAGGGNDSPQVIGITDHGSQLVSLGIHFDQTGNSTLHLVNGGGTDLLDASTGDTYTLGHGLGTGGPGESASRLLSDLHSLRIVDSVNNDSFSITFTLDDTTSHASTTFQEFFKTACYTPGTRIGTPAGEVAVEDLQIGDLVSTTSGAAKPVKWIGRRSYPAATVARAANLRPVLVRKGALGSALPSRDLMVSPMHALLIDEVFVPAAALVNGVSILRRELAGAAEYIHVELDQHEVIFAEGVPAETFVDDNSRAMFENVAEYYDLYGTTESPRGFSAPRIEEGYQLEAIRSRIAGQAARAVAPGSLAGHVEQLADGVLEGWVMDRANPTAPVELEVLVDGEIVATVLANRYRADLDHAGLGDGRCGFSVAMPASAEAIMQVEVRRASDGGQVAMPQRTLVTA
jgi:hypothetical protein